MLSIVCNSTYGYENFIEAYFEKSITDVQNLHSWKINFCFQ